LSVMRSVGGRSSPACSSRICGALRGEGRGEWRAHAPPSHPSACAHLAHDVVQALVCDLTQRSTELVLQLVRLRPARDGDGVAVDAEEADVLGHAQRVDALSEPRERGEAVVKVDGGGRAFDELALGLGLAGGPQPVRGAVARPVRREALAVVEHLDHGRVERDRE
jgi:hypothetical protein